MEESEAQSFFPGLPNPFTIGDLKRIFRQESFKAHPDQGGTDEAFNSLKIAYGMMEGKATHSLGAEAKVLKATDGTPLSELGNGLDALVNAVGCETCQGKGYKQYFNAKEVADCDKCEGSGIHFYPCKKCQGSGEYKHPRTGKAVGKCNLCGGTGRFYPRYQQRSHSRTTNAFRSFFESIHSLQPKKVQLPNGKFIPVNNCMECNGNGWKMVENKNKPTYERCWECKGTGEIRIYNPVIPKGLLLDSNV